MKYEIKGDNLPVVLCHLEAGEEMTCEGGSMSWMDDEIEMKTQAGGIGKALSRMFTGEKMFQNKYIAKSAGEIAFAGGAERRIPCQLWQYRGVRVLSEEARRGILRRRRLPHAEVFRQRHRVP